MNILPYVATPATVERAKAEAAKERDEAEAQILEFENARLECLHTLGAYIEVFGVTRMQAFLNFKIAEAKRLTDSTR